MSRATTATIHIDALRHNLAQVRALEQLEILQVEGARFLDVQTRLEALRARLPKPPVPTTDGEKPRRKKKISFI